MRRLLLVLMLTVGLTLGATPRVEAAPERPAHFYNDLSHWFCGHNTNTYFGGASGQSVLYHSHDPGWYGIWYGAYGWCQISHWAYGSLCFLTIGYATPPIVNGGMCSASGFP